MDFPRHIQRTKRTSLALTQRHTRGGRRNGSTALAVLLSLSALGSACGTSADAGSVITDQAPAGSPSATVTTTAAAKDAPATTAAPTTAATKPAPTTTAPTTAPPDATADTNQPVGTDPTTTALESEPVVPLTVTDETGSEITVESVERIIPLDGDIAEIVFALDLGANVVATDLSATYPPEADALPEIGYQRALSAEAIAAFEPTILLATDIAGPPEALDDMRRLGFPLIIVPNENNAQGAGRKIRAVATALGVPNRGEALASQVDQAIASAAVVPGTFEAPLRVIALYLRGTSAQLVFGETTNTHWLIEAAGGIDVSTAMGITDPVPISTEAILAAAPHVVLVPEAGLKSVNGIDGLLEIGGIAETPAGRARAVLAYDDQLLLGNGPRTGELLSQFKEDLQRIASASTP